MNADSEYPTLKKKLEEALKNRDPQAIEKIMDQIERTVPSGKIPESDKPLHDQAKSVTEKLDNPLRLLIQM